MTATLVIFFVTYLLIAGRGIPRLPIGRPAGALVGACALVALSLVDPNGLTPKEAFRAVDLDTIGMLFGMMILTAGVLDGGIFEHMERWIAKRRLSPAILLQLVTIGSGFLSAVLLNDSVCLLLAPFVDRLARRGNLARIPYLLALAMGSNAGSAMTLAGNPQNMLVASLSAIPYRSYLLAAGPAGLAALATTALVLHVVFRGKLVRPTSNAPLVSESAALPKPSVVPLVIVVLVSIAFIAGANLAWTAIIGATLLILSRRSDADPLFSRVSWSVLVFFAALFIVVAGLAKAHVTESLFRIALPWMPSRGVSASIGLSGALLVGCQLLSNVPFILIVEPLVHAAPDPRLAWMVVALVSTLAGNLTLLGSVANVIVIETVNAQKEVGFWSYLRVGAPVTLASTAVGLAVLLLMNR